MTLARTWNTSKFFNSNQTTIPNYQPHLTGSMPSRGKADSKTTTLKRKRDEGENTKRAIVEVFNADEAIDHSICVVSYPLDPETRCNFRTKDGKSVTPHQWDVYDLTRKIPFGKVTTYKHLCYALGSGSPRSVGSALRNNPFAPFVPCHRIIASNHFVGGFCGQWGLNDSDAQLKHSGKRARSKRNHEKCAEKEDLVLKKLTLLAQEGVGFDSDGKVINPDGVIWIPSN